MFSPVRGSRPVNVAVLPVSTALFTSIVAGVLPATAPRVDSSTWRLPLINCSSTVLPRLSLVAKSAVYWAARR